jgi:putative flippase GtrA
MLSAVIIKYFDSDKRAITLFLGIGALTALVYFTLFTVIWQLLHIDYRIAVTISYLTAISFHFLMNRKITFQAACGNFIPHVMKYAVMTSINYVITILIVEFSVKLLLLSPYLGVLIALGVTVVTGYLMLKFWVFQINGRQISS